jgi:hypothetical protein
MKKIVLIGLSAVAFSAFADSPYQPSGPQTQPSSPGHHNHHHPRPHHNHGGNPSIQATMLMNTAVTNSATGFFGRAEQNLASQVGTLNGNKPEVQLVMARDSIITNESMGGTATQNIASNTGDGGLNPAKYQMAIFSDSSVINRAGFGARAVQNISSTTNCITCDSGMSHHD